jgi:cbb3-type cytochrome oxidase subunit 3
VFWAYSKKRKPEFDAAALLPLDEEDTPNANRPVAFATHKSENAQ